MKILTKEEETAHYNATLKGGIVGGIAGLGVGTAAVLLGSRRFPTIATLTLPMKTFLITSSATFATIVSADRSSRQFDETRDPQRRYRDQASQRAEEARAQEGRFQKGVNYLRDHRFAFIVGGWAASMAGSWVLINRSNYLTKSQKLVQARVVAQGVTIALILASAALELGDARKGQGRWETITVLDPDDPEHKRVLEKKVHKESYEGEDLWRDMVEAEERKQKKSRAEVERIEREDHEKKKQHEHHDKSTEQHSKKDDTGDHKSSKKLQQPDKSSAEHSSTTAASHDQNLAPDGKSALTNKGQSPNDPRHTTPSPGPTPTQGKGTANKHRILTDANKKSDKSEEEIAKMEYAKLREQERKHSEVRREGVQSGQAAVKVADRNDV